MAVSFPLGGMCESLNADYAKQPCLTPGWVVWADKGMEKCIVQEKHFLVWVGSDK